MRTLPGYCIRCGRLLLWVGSSRRSLYCCEGCGRGACTCRETGLHRYHKEMKNSEMSTASPDQYRNPSASPRILVVDDDAEMRALLLELLRHEGWDPDQAANGAEALIRLRTEPFAAIILDKNMPGLSGLDLLPGLRKLCPGTPVILITAFGDVETYVDAVEKGAFAYLFKPFRMEELVQVLQRVLAMPRPSAPPAAASGDYHASAR